MSDRPSGDTRPSPASTSAAASAGADDRRALLLVLVAAALLVTASGCLDLGDPASVHDEPNETPGSGPVEDPTSRDERDSPECNVGKSADVREDDGSVTLEITGYTNTSDGRLCRHVFSFDPPRPTSHGFDVARLVVLVDPNGSVQRHRYYDASGTERRTVRYRGRPANGSVPVPVP